MYCFESNWSSIMLRILSCINLTSIDRTRAVENDELVAQSETHLVDSVESGLRVMDPVRFEY
jgi:hypothetical protein